MAEDTATEAANAAEEVSKHDDLEALKETAKEKLEASISKGKANIKASSENSHKSLMCTLH